MELLFVRRAWASSALSVAILLMTVLVAGCGADAAKQELSEGPATAEVSWDVAGSHIGENVAVGGQVVSTHYAGTSNRSPTFLNVGSDYADPGRFTVVIFGNARSAFPAAPEDIFDGKNIVVHGVIEAYRGIPQVIVTSPDDIIVLD